MIVCMFLSVQCGLASAHSDGLLRPLQSPASGKMQFSWQVAYIACPCHGRSASVSGGGQRTSSCSDRRTFLRDDGDPVWSAAVAPASVVEYIVLSPAVTAARAPGVKHMSRAPAVIVARAAVESSPLHLLEVIAARAPAVEYIAPSLAGDRSTCGSGGVDRSSPCLARSACASGGVHRTVFWR